MNLATDVAGLIEPVNDVNQTAQSAIKLMTAELK